LNFQSSLKINNTTDPRGAHLTVPELMPDEIRN